MRMNVYSQELHTHGPTKAVELVQKVADTGVVYSAVRLFLISPLNLHHTDEDDDRSAITFWLPKSPERREYIALCFERLAQMIRRAPAEDGLD